MSDPSSPIGVVTLDAHGTLLAWNREAETLLKAPERDALGVPLLSLFPPGEHDRLRRFLAQCNSEGESCPPRIFTRDSRSGGPPQRLEIRVAALPGGDGDSRCILLLQEISERERADNALREESRIIETINRVGQTLSAELDLQKLVQSLTDAATEITGAQFGAFFHNVIDRQGESYMLYTLSGAPREAFEKFPMPRNTALFAPTFGGEGILRSDDITQDPRYGQNAPYHGMPDVHLPVRSYLSVPVISRSGEVIGGLFFGHAEPGRFNERHERILAGIASQAAVAIDNARLYQKTREAEEQLRQQLEFTSAITRNMGEGIYTLDAEGRVTFMNPAAERMLDWKEEELLGRPVHDAIHYQNALGERVPAENCPLLEVLRSRKVIFNDEDLFTRRDGATFPVSIISSPLLKEGEVAGAVLSFRDLTERKQTEAALRESENKLRALFDNTTEAILIADDAGAYVDANPAATELFGVPYEQLLGMNVADFAPPEQAGTVRAMWEQFLREGEQSGEFPLLRPDGSHRRLEFRAKANFLPGLHLSVVRDVTLRKEMEEALRSSEEQFRTLIEQSPLSVQILSPEGRTLQVNRAWETLWGVTPDQIAGYNILQDPQLVEKGIMPYVQRGFAGEATEIPPILYNPEETIPGLHPEGDPRRWVRAFIYPVRDPEGRITKVVLIHEDFSERQRLEDELRRRAEDLAEEAKRKDNFLAMLAHELRNPLAPILSAVHIMKMRGGEDPALQRARDVVERQVNHMARLIDELLDLSRINRGKITLQKRRIQLAAAFEGAAQTVRPLIESRRHELQISLPEVPLALDADPDRLEQILNNLLNNAAKYTEPGGRIDLIGERDDREVVIRVRDTGMGVEPEMLPHVFDLFSQADRSLDRSRGGLGIGLTLVKNLVGLHGGSVEAHSAGAGKGSEFVARLPLTAPDLSLPQSPASGPVHAAQVPLQVLVIEDNPDGREMLKNLLEMWGHRLEAAGNGPDGVERARVNPPDVALIDIGLPTLDGYQVARQIRATLGERCPTLVALTGYGQPEALRRAKEAGFDAHLVKPVNPEALKILLAEVGKKRV
ncbi:MAG: PAS domain S-box protein [Armatimonadetes bacterium]|nr:PAS domain S-box protein [Armatimonadota bacterium]